MMKKDGLENARIIDHLKGKGYSYEQISDALTQAEIKANVEGVPAPAPTPQPSTHPSGMQPSMMSEGRPPAMQHHEPSPPPPAMPQPSFVPPMPQQHAVNVSNIDRGMDERIAEVAEAIISEKWQKMMEDVGDFSVWKDRVRTSITSMKQEILRVEQRFETLQKAILGKVNEYDKNITNVGSDIKALEKLLQKIIQPLTENVNELGRITKELKK